MTACSPVDLRTLLVTLRAALQHGRLTETPDLVRNFANRAPPEVLARLGDLWTQLAEQWLTAGLTAPVIDVLGALSEAPDIQVAVARAYRARGEVDAAKRRLTEVLAASPGFGPAHLTWGGIARDEGRHDEAIRHFRRAAQGLGGHPLPWVRLGYVHLDAGQLEEAAAAFDEALERSPDDPSATAGHALVLERRGDAGGAFKRLAPLAASPLPHPSVVVGFAAAARRVGRPAEALAAAARCRTGRWTDRENQLVAFAEGDLLDALGRHDEAFEAFTRANALGRGRFDGPAFRRQIQDQIEALRPPLPTSTCRDESPVLIVGMPRTGTTLVNQMLTRHPKVAGAGELSYWGQLAEGLPAWTGAPDAVWYRRLDHAPPELLDQMATAYLDRLRQLGGSEARFVTDKMPHNALYLSVVAMVCPHARVIHCTRDPRDSGWSCYRQPFAGAGLAFSESLAGIGHWSRGIDALMAHQKAVLPLRIHTVRYEALVNDVEAETRALCTFLDLPWDPACAAPHHNPRYTATASYAQVREAPHRRAVGKHRPYAAHLGPLFEILEGA